MSASEAQLDRSPEFSPPADEDLTPAMRQYWTQKREVPDALLLFRMGDFYETFYDDAKLAARVLGITLTSRDKGRTPLAGIPHHALESYLAKLVAAGYKVAISEQTQDPREAKGVVDRAIVRVVTPGTLTDDGLLDQTRPSVLVAVYPTPEHVGVAALDLSTGYLTVALQAADGVLDELGRLDPAEVLLPEPTGAGRHPLDEPIRARLETTLTYRGTLDFAPDRAAHLLREHFETQGLEGFGFDTLDASLQAAGGLLAYVRETQKAAARHIQPPRRLDRSASMVLDPVTLRSLEIERTLRTGQRAGTLLAAVDRTCNPMGARLLRHWLCFPARDLTEIGTRQATIAHLRGDAPRRTELRKALRAMGDVERMVGRLGVLRTTPRDLRALGDALSQLPALRDLLGGCGTPECAALAAALEGVDDVAAALTAALAPEAPLTMREGGIFASGHHAELDRLRALNADQVQWLANYQAGEIQRTGISSLKVAYNKVFGFYIEVTHAHSERVPANYVRKQTMKNAERYITDELKQYEAEALTAEARAHELEYDLFVALRDSLVGHIPAMQQAAAALARLDVLAGWADLAVERKCCRPEFVADVCLEIVDGRHPVLDQTLAANFVPNDTQLAAQRQSLALITGPNMAGKSTYIRQVALLALLAHCGAWVPAKSMRLGLIDRIFTRVGAADELARNQSTFMVEMVETANILHNATAHSLVILDEIGRGTSTFDGVALAWAITEHLASTIGCRTLFATHYHELTELSEILDNVFNLNVAVREYEDQVVFLHRIVPGSTGRSYGLHVAKLAGVPRAVLERANAVLNELEQTFSRESQRPVLAAVQRRRLRQLRLFEEPEETIVRQLRDLDCTGLDADGARQQIQRWRQLLGLETPPDAAP